MSLARDYLPNYTYEDLIQWEGRWELIDGIAHAMSPMAMPSHQFISNKIAGILYEQLKDCKECFAFLPIDWRIDDGTVVQPDNLVLCYKPKKSYITKPPKIIFEVISKSTAKKDEIVKFSIYEREKVDYYILVYPDENLAKVFKYHDGRYMKVLDATDESYTFEIEKCKIEFDFSKIWYE